MTRLTCGHPPDMIASMITDSGEKLDVSVCNRCYDYHKDEFEKHKLEVIPQ